MSISYLKRGDDFPEIAYQKSSGTADLPTVVFLCGFKSDMGGTKAVYLEKMCGARGQGFMRFDYSGHGASGGKFEDGTIGSWLSDTLAVIDELTEGPLMLVGSSMGGWLALLAAHERGERVAGLLGIASAPDFTREMESRRLKPAQVQELHEAGFVKVASSYGDEPYIITKKLVEDGNRHCLLDTDMKLKMPIRLVHGMKDDDVEWQIAHRIKNAVCDDNRNVEVLLIEDGDHRLSKPHELELLDKQVQDLNELYQAK